jgi:hydrogenase expression/formation protein HypD
MVSSEGACAAYYNYGRIDTSRIDQRRVARQSVKSADGVAPACLGASGVNVATELEPEIEPERAPGLMDDAIATTAARGVL